MTKKTEKPRKRGKRLLFFGLAMGAAVFALQRWYKRPASKTEGGTLLDQFLPESEFNGQVSVPIQASPRAIFQALRTVTLADMPLATLIGELRYAAEQKPDVAQDESSATQPFMELLMANNANILLAEAPEREMVLGSVGKFHELVDQQIAPLANPQAFIDFDDPEYQKLAMSFRVSGHDPADGYRLTLEHRTHALSPTARRNFARYWLAIKPGGNFVSWLLLRAVKQRAETVEAVETGKAVGAYSE
jgi:hypothetical protein